MNPVTYLLLKYLHVVGAMVLLGAGIGIAFFMLMAHRSRDAAFVARTASVVVLADVLFTATAVVAQPVTGYLLLRETGSVRAVNRLSLRLEEGVSVVEPLEGSTALPQGLPAPRLDDAAIDEDEHEVRSAHRREAVGDHEGGAPLHRALDAPDHVGLGLRIEGRGRLVEDQDARVPKEGPGDGDALHLALG